RLFYVGITRAEDSLVITHARRRRRNGETMPSMRSTFLGEIPPALFTDRATIRLRGSGRDFDRPTAAERRPGVPFGFQRPVPPFADEDVSQDAPRFIKGERVHHARFGGGVIVELGGLGKDTKVTIDFDDEEIGRKRLVVAYANLTRGDE
ncbi:MAG TPA: hypothetical protein VF981_13970, partial [Gemmatimonadaceae bacterium]